MYDALVYKKISVVWYFKLGTPAYETFQRLMFGDILPTNEAFTSQYFTIVSQVCLIMQIKGFVTDPDKSLGGLTVHIQLSHDNRSVLVLQQRPERLVERWLEVDLPAGEYQIMIVVRGNLYTEFRIYDLLLQQDVCSNPCKWCFACENECLL